MRPRHPHCPETICKRRTGAHDTHIPSATFIANPKTHAALITMNGRSRMRLNVLENQLQGSAQYQVCLRARTTPSATNTAPSLAIRFSSTPATRTRTSCAHAASRAIRRQAARGPSTSSRAPLIRPRETIQLAHPPPLASDIPLT